MKIQSLYIENLNSLYGRWQIDFTAPEYAAGIFAIIGPTGSGKTTILDAITLALYGETPRIDGRGIGKEKNDLFSIGATQSIVELSFETGGRNYRARFEQRAATRADAQAPFGIKKHTLSRDGAVIVEKTTRVPAAIAELIGLARPQFTQAVLLAQGEFNAFLKAQTDDRAAILEQITGTEIYREISVAVAERHVREQHELELAAAGLQSQSLLSAAELAAKQAELTTHGAQWQRLNTILNELEKLDRALENRARYQAEITRLTAEITQGELRRSAFAQAQQQLDNAAKAAELEPEFQSLTTRRAAQQQLLNEIAQAQLELPRRQNAAQTAQTEALRATRRLNELLKLQDAAAARLAAVRARDAELDAARNAATAHQRQLDALRTAGEQALRRRQAAQQRADQAADAVAAAEDYLRQNAADEALPLHRARWLADHLQWTERAVALRDGAAALTALAERRQKAETEIAAAQAELDAAGVAAAQLEREVAAKEERLQTALAGNTKSLYRELRDSLQQLAAHRQKVLALDAERRKLAPHSPCPLCGATVHPYCDGTPWVMDDADRKLAEVNTTLQTIENAETELNAVLARRLEPAQRLAAAQTRLAVGRQNHAALDEAWQERRKTLEQAQSEFDRHAAARNAELAVYHCSWPLGAPPPPELDQRIAAYSEARERREVALRELHRNAGERDAADAELNARQAERDELNQSTADRIAACDQAQRQRFALFGTRTVAAYEKRLTQALAAAHRRHTAATTACGVCRAGVEQLEPRIATLNAQLAGAEPELAAATRTFHARCVALGFADEATFNAARLDATTLATLRKQADQIHGALHAATTQLAEYRELMARENAILPPATDPDALREERSRHAAARTELDRIIGALNAELERDACDRRQFAARRQAYQEKTAEAQLWAQLNALIGARDGKKFCRIAQGVTFDQLLAYANLELQKMSDRYRLLRGDSEALAIMVIDAWQGGERRSADNLSGGESFIVSLALALGLASMAGEKIDLGNIFLDEGFGTLDETHLAVALNTLAHLKTAGKLVGVISHVPQLAELIPVQIQVIPQGGGRSSLAGPGVLRLPSTAGKH